MTIKQRPERIQLAPGLEISRMITGLWQVADQERSGALDQDLAAAELCAYAQDGFDTFDMADHYGSAELIAGVARRRCDSDTALRLFTKWCPPPGPMIREIVRRGIAERVERLDVDCIDLLQLHWWSFEHPAYIDALDELVRLQQEGLIAHIGLTNVDTDHLRLLLSEGFPIATNQVCLSLLDRRALRDMSQVCLENSVKLLAYGTLAGGFLSDRWLGEPAPATIPDWSKMKYIRFIEATGGWAAFQRVLAALAEIATRHTTTVSSVATRWVLDQPAVGAVIIGARLTERDHRDGNVKTFEFELSADDRTCIDAALDHLTDIPGDCGDEYRRPPFLTASGDLSHHLQELPKFFSTRSPAGRPDWLQIDSASEWESVCGYCRALRVGDRILVSGTTATHGSERVMCRGDVRGQAVYILDKIIAAVVALGGESSNIIRTRIYLANADDWDAVSRVHGRYFGAQRPANTLIEVSRLVGDYLVEIEAEAVVTDSAG